MKLSIAQVYFYAFSWFKPIRWILHTWSTGFKWVNYPISCAYLSLDNVFIFFITHTSETALEWIFSKFKHIYEPISSQKSPSTCLSIWKFILKFKTPKRFKRLASLEMFSTATSVHFVFTIMHVLLHQETTENITLHFFPSTTYKSKKCSWGKDEIWK